MPNEVTKRHRQLAADAQLGQYQDSFRRWIETGKHEEFTGAKRIAYGTNVLPLERTAQALADAEARALDGLGPVAGERLRVSLACHIDHDEPPGMAARDMAGTVLALLDGCRNNGSTAFRLHRDLLDLAERYGKETT